MFEMVVEEVNLYFGEYIKDGNFWINPQDFESGKRHDRYCKFRLLRTSNSYKLKLNFLTSKGLKAAPQSCQRNMPKQLIDYIEKEFEHGE